MVRRFVQLDPTGENILGVFSFLAITLWLAGSLLWFIREGHLAGRLLALGVGQEFVLSEGGTIMRRVG